MSHPSLGERPGDWVGPYKLLEIVGEGGFGTVWLAERREPIVQRVALKVIKPGMDTRAVVARFEQERQALAVMDHPFIAKVFDAGATPSGRPYFVMEYVKGESITEYCDRHRLTIRERLELFIQVCEAVQHAHHKGIIHRDIKPSNILVTPVGDQGSKHAGTTRGVQVKVIDFGVAKAISHSLTDKTIFTEHGQIIGTPEYMSPEQAEMGATDIDTRTDVYSLGVVLYELLSGTLPFDPKTLRAAGYAEIQRIIREVDPPKPSTRLSTADEKTGAAIARARHAEREQIACELRRELDWIPLKALRKDRTERYESPLEIARDVRAYLRGDALIARPETTGDIIRRLLRRHPGRAFQAACSVSLIYVIVILPLMTSLSETRARLIRVANTSDLSFAHGLLWGRVLGSVDEHLSAPPDQWCSTNAHQLVALYETVAERQVANVHEVLVRLALPEEATAWTSQSDLSMNVDWKSKWQDILETHADAEIKGFVRRSLQNLALSSHNDSHPIISPSDPLGSWVYFTTPSQSTDEGLSNGDIGRATHHDLAIENPAILSGHLRRLEEHRRDALRSEVPHVTSLVLSRFWTSLLAPPVALVIAICYLGSSSLWRCRALLLPLLAIAAAASGACIPLALASLPRGGNGAIFVVSSVFVAAIGISIGWLRSWKAAIFVVSSLLAGAVAVIAFMRADPYKVVEVIYLLDTK